MREARGGGEDLPLRLAAGLAVALEELARDPRLARSLTVRPFLDDEEPAIGALYDWIDRFGDLLRDAAAADPRANDAPSFVAPFLIGAVRPRIARRVLRDEASDLPRLLPGICEALLAYYFEPVSDRTIRNWIRRG